MADQNEATVESQAVNSNDDEPLVSPRDHILINRLKFNELKIEQVLTPKAIPPPLQRVLSVITPPEPVLSGIKPPLSRSAWLRFLLTHLPILHWMWTYKAQYLFRDIIAGISVAMLHVPQGLAYGLLAGLDPVYGLYTSFVPVIMYSIFGTSKHLSIGTFAVVSLLIRNSVKSVLIGKGLDYCTSLNHRLAVVVLEDGSNITCNDLKVQIAVSLAFTSGLIMVVMGLLKMGFVTLLLSDPLISGYTTASAVLVISSQLSQIFGLSFQINSLSVWFPGLLSFPRTVVEVFIEVFQWPKYVNTATFVASLISFFILIVLDIVNNKLIARIKICCCLYSSQNKKCHTSKRFPFPLRIPIALVLVVFSIGVSSAIDYEHRWNGTVVGTVATRPEFMLASLPNAVLIAIVSFVISVSVADLLAKKYKYTVNSSQELIAYGVSNVIGSLFSSYCATGSISRSGFQASAGGKTQLTSLISSIVVCVVLISLVSLFRALPQAVLGVIVCMGLFGMFKQFKDIVRYFRLSFADLLAWIVVFVATLLLGVDLGLITGVVFSLLLVLIRTALPYSAVLGQVPGTEIFRNITHFDKVFHCHEESSGVHIVDVIPQTAEHSDTGTSGAGSAEHSAGGPLHTIVIDCAPMGFIDAVGVKTLTQIVDDFGNAGIQVMIAAMTKENRDMLDRSGFYKKFGKEWLFPTLQDAVELAKSGSSLLQIQEAIEMPPIGHGTADMG
eukprot:Em0016g594a